MTITINFDAVAEFCGFSLVDVFMQPVFTAHWHNFTYEISDLASASIENRPRYIPQQEKALAQIIADRDSCLTRHQISSLLFLVCGIQIPDPDKPGIVTMPARLHSYSRGQETKLGRALRRYLALSDAEIESILNQFLDSADPARLAKAFTYTSGDSRNDFHAVYSASVASGDGGNGFNSLQGSCMQGTRKHICGKHPAQAYASGDFAIYAAWKEHRLAARVVISKDNRAATPIYACGNAAGRALTQWLANEHDIAIDDLTDDLSGYSMEAIQTGNGGYLMPYLDCRESLEFNDDHFYIGQGDIETSTDGYVTGEPMSYCECCEDRVSEDEINYIESEEIYVCDHCLRQNYTESDLSGIYYADSNSTTYLGRNYREFNCGSDETDDLCYSEYHSNYIHNDFAIYIESIEDYVHCDDDTEELDGELYLVDSQEYRDKQEEIELREQEEDESSFYFGHVNRIDSPDQLDFDDAIAVCQCDMQLHMPMSNAWAMATTRGYIGYSIERRIEAATFDYLSAMRNSIPA